MTHFLPIIVACIISLMVGFAWGYLMCEKREKYWHDLADGLNKILYECYDAIDARDKEIRILKAIIESRETARLDVSLLQPGIKDTQRTLNNIGRRP